MQKFQHKYIQYQHNEEASKHKPLKHIRKSDISQSKFSSGCKMPCGATKKCNDDKNVCMYK